ncbi:ParB/RepB/Spo0J family partition protein (plasmid) [Acinetobacter nosocomialis]|nr:ParB/RepB/Spo0J family partition protein [Acinetobacter nosocomialis]
MSSLLDLVLDGDESKANSAKQTEIELHLIDLDPENPRKTFIEAKEKDLEESIRESGVRIPVILIKHPHDDNRFIVKDGNRRVKNSLRAGLQKIPAVVVESFSELDQLTANTMNEDMTIYDISRAIVRLKAKGYSQRQIGKTLAYGDAKVSKIVAITDGLDEEILETLEDMCNRNLLNDFSAMYEIAVLYRDHKVDVRAWVEKQSATAKKLVLRKYRNSKTFETDLEKDKPKSKEVSLNETVIEDILSKAKESLPLVSKLHKGEIKDPEEREEVVNSLGELIKDLTLILKQYK